jgi:hypothetical protein
LVWKNVDGEALNAMAQSPSEAEKVGDSNQRVPKNLPPSIQDAHFLLQVSSIIISFLYILIYYLIVVIIIVLKNMACVVQDLCSLTGGDHPIWLPVQAISKTFGYELIEALLSTHQPLFIHIYEFQLLLKVFFLFLFNIVSLFIFILLY